MPYWKMLTSSTVLATLLMSAPPLHAQAAQNCGPRQAVIDQLANRFGETRRSVGLGGNNTVVEVFASDTSGSWSITVTRADGVTCLGAAGKAYETMTVEPASEAL